MFKVSKQGKRIPEAALRYKRKWPRSKQCKKGQKEREGCVGRQ